METAKQENPDKTQLLEITNKISEECWMCMDKYLCAGFAMLSRDFGKLDGRAFYPKLNEAGTLVLGADYAVLFRRAVAEYERYYKSIIAKVKSLQETAFLANPAKRQINAIDLSTFKWLADQQFADENTAKMFAAYYEVAKNINDLDANKLTKLPHKRFLPAIKKISEGLLAIKPIGKITKIELADTPSQAPAGIEVANKDTKQAEQEKTGAPDNVKHDVANLAKMVATIKDDPKNVQQNFQQIKQAQLAMNKTVAKYLQTTNADNFKKAAAFIKKLNGQVIPTLWCLSTLTGLRNDVSNVFEAVVQDEMLSLLIERRGKKKHKKPMNLTQNNAAGTTANDETHQNIESSEADALLNQVSELLKTTESSDFAKKYEEWAKKIEELASKSPEAAKLKNKDPYEQLLSLCVIEKQKLTKNTANESVGNAFVKRLNDRFANW